MNIFLCLMAIPVLLATDVRDTRAAAPAPNVVILLADDLGWGDVGFNGRASRQTPRLDRLAGQGAALRRFYTGAVVCAPSRGVLLTGKYTIHNGVTRNDQDLPASELTIAEFLRARGYTTALFGKWHHGKPRAGGSSYVHPMDQGFDAFFGFTNATHAWEKFPRELWEGRELKPSTGHADDLFADRAVAFLRERAADARPFVLYVPFTATHFHVEAPQEDLERQRGRFEEVDPAQPWRAAYAAMVARLDHNVGRVVDAIDALGLAQSTLVIFTSDHGATFESGNKGASAYHDSNAPLRGQKRTLWEGGIRVPALARWSGRIPPGSVLYEPMHMMDLFSTIAAAVGAPAPADLDGANLLEAWEGNGPLAVRTLFWEWRSEAHDQLAAMRGDFKLVVTRGGKPELFDVTRDPAERIDLAAEHPEIVEDLRARLAAWLATERKDE